SRSDPAYGGVLGGQRALVFTRRRNSSFRRSLTLVSGMNAEGAISGDPNNGPRPRRVPGANARRDASSDHGGQYGSRSIVSVKLPPRRLVWARSPSSKTITAPHVLLALCRDLAGMARFPAALQAHGIHVSLFSDPGFHVQSSRFVDERHPCP